MEIPKRTRSGDRTAGDAIDEQIRRRFRACESLPLFPEPPPVRLRAPGFFQPCEIGRQLRLTDLKTR